MQESPCRKYPCANIAGAIVDSCSEVGGLDFKCECQGSFEWNDDTNACLHGSKKLLFT